MRIILQCILLLFIIGQTHAQEANGFGNSTNGTQHSSSPSSSPTIKPTSTNSTTLSPAEPYLLIRPLQDLQISLHGTYNSTDEEEQLLVMLKSLLEESLFRAMVEYFIPELFQEDWDNNIFNRTNMNMTTTMDEQEVLKWSILSNVFLEWTMAKPSAQITEDPNIHIFQARSLLGFKEYDYVLLHPRTILPLQEQIIAASNGGGNDTNSTSISLSEIDMALQKNGFGLEVLQLIIVVDEKRPPTASPTVLPLGDDVDDNDVKKKDHDEDKTPEEDNTTSFDDKDGEQEPSKFASKERIQMALVVAAGASGIAFCLFLISVRIKSINIKRDRFVQKQRLSQKMDAIGTNKGGTKDNSSDSKKVSKLTVGMYSGTTPAGSMDELSMKSTSSSSVDDSFSKPSSMHSANTNTTIFEGAITDDVEAPKDNGEKVERKEKKVPNENKNGARSKNKSGVVYSSSL